MSLRYRSFWILPSVFPRPASILGDLEDERALPDEGSAGPAAQICADVDGTRRILFQIIDASPSLGKFVHISPAAGKARVSSDSIAISICEPISTGGDLCVACQYVSGAVHILDVMKLEFQSLGQMEEWGMGAPVWYLRDFVKDAAISKAMTELATASALPRRHKLLQRRPDDPCARVAQKLGGQWLCGSPRRRLLVLV